MDDIVVTSDIQKQVDRIFDVVEMEKPEDVIREFKDNYDLLMKYIPKDVLDGVINSKIYVSTIGSADDFGRGIIFKTEKGDIVSVCPFVKEKK